MRASILAILGLAACTTSTNDGTDPAVAQRRCELYVDNCAGCHGTHAHGDGPHGEHLDPAPTNLVDGGALAPEDPQWMDVVRGGRADMPAFADLLSEADMQATADHVQSLRAGAAPSCAATAGTDGDTDTHGTDDGHSSTTDHGVTTDHGSEESGGHDSSSGGNASSSTSTSTDGGSTSTGGGPSDACVAWCSCLEASCSSLERYPYESEVACHQDCATKTDEEIACWQGFCDNVADNPALADHNCDHAWGDLGLAEC